MEPNVKQFLHDLGALGYALDDAQELCVIKDIEVSEDQLIKHLDEGVKMREFLLNQKLFQLSLQGDLKAFAKFKEMLEDRDGY